MSRGARLAAGLIACALSAATVAGCASPPPRVPTPRGEAPGPTQVRQAVARLHDTLAKQEGWPAAHLTRSRDFPELALLKTTPFEDRGRWGVELETLQRTLEKAIREGFVLRLQRDEAAVPEWLRDKPEGEGSEVAPPAGEGIPDGPSLELRAWAGGDARIHLELVDRTTSKTLVECESPRAE